MWLHLVYQVFSEDFLKVVYHINLRMCGKHIEYHCLKEPICKIVYKTITSVIVLWLTHEIIFSGSSWKALWSLPWKGCPSCAGAHRSWILVLVPCTGVPCVQVTRYVTQRLTLWGTFLSLSVNMNVIPPLWLQREQTVVTCGAIHHFIVTATQMPFLSLLVTSRMRIWSVPCGLGIQESRVGKARRAKKLYGARGVAALYPASSPRRVDSAFFTTAAHSRTVENSDTLWQVNSRKSLLNFFAKGEFSLIIVDAFILVCRWGCKKCWRIDFCLSISPPFLWHFSHF